MENKTAVTVEEVMEKIEKMQNEIYVVSSQVGVLYGEVATLKKALLNEKGSD